jgi:hypothetical protein
VHDVVRALGVTPDGDVLGQVIIDGLRSAQRTPLPGHAPTRAEQTERWIKR